MKLWRRSSNRKWRRGAISGLRKKCNNFAIFRPIWPKFGPKLDLRMGHRDAMLPERYGAVRGAAAPFPAAPPSKWRPFNNSVIFQPICFKFGWKVDRRMGNDVATPPQRYSAVLVAVVPFPAAPPLKWCPFNNCRFLANLLQIWVEGRL